jgi:hypothetical protein
MISGAVTSGNPWPRETSRTVAGGCTDGDADPDRTVLLLRALYSRWGSAIPAMKLMVDTVPPLGGAVLVFLLPGLVLAVASCGRPAPTNIACAAGLPGSML